MIVILYPFLIRILNITEERPNTYTHTTMPFLYPRMLFFMSGEIYIYTKGEGIEDAIVAHAQFS